MSGIDLGVFARCFPAQAPEPLGRAIADAGFSSVQLNLSAVGLPTIPDAQALEDIDLVSVRRDLEAPGLRIWGLSGSYNLAHPDQERARVQTEDAARLIRRAPELGVVAVTLCTGSRNPDDMWRAHPDNDTAEAWADLLRNLGPLLDAADEADVFLAVEPEPGNVISGTDAAVRLLDELGERASRIGFILDPANLVGETGPDDYETVLRDAFDRLGSRAICVHAKDVVTWDERIAGAAGLDFDLVRALHAALPRPVPVIVQDADPANLAAVRALVLGDA
ncbi:sugar phosphate isomerase/epimerase family protein [Plantibacter sp. ME-Dv--P-122b]|uniref:sugar phosphate isomerase/epimerase family protein n=1 Tax=Plantibacter sp. ME-Dv--P-122b TaxID=3040300 RepID=UPI002550AFC5|nr:sugar phosphate isomerase/epimerase family protein [Plantibacter sp. ME-Dv--P-122b]